MWMLTSLLPILIVCCAMYLLPPSWKKKKKWCKSQNSSLRTSVFNPDQHRSAPGGWCTPWCYLPQPLVLGASFPTSPFVMWGFNHPLQLPSRWPQGSSLVDQNVGTRVFCWCSPCPFSHQVSPAVYSVYTSGRRRKVGWAFAQEVGIGSQLSFLLPFLIYVCF